MAWAPCASSSVLPLPSSSSSSSSFVVVARRASSASIPSPSSSSSSSIKLPRTKKNHLRSKILKTLTKPPQTSSLQSEPVETLRNLSESLEIVEQTELVLYSNEEVLTERSGESDGNRESSVRVPVSTETKLPEMDAAFIARAVVEIALYFVGLFVVQTVCTVVFVMASSGGAFSKSGNGVKEDELGVSRAGDASLKKTEWFWFGEKILRLKGDAAAADVVTVDRIGMEEKIVEIRAMARKAREMEMKKLSANAAVASSEDLNRGIKTNIEKEVDLRLIKMEKKLCSVEKKPLTSVNYEAKVKDNKILESSDAANAKENAVGSKKKFKFRKPWVKSRNVPKGFGRGKNHNVVNESRKSGGKASRFSIESDANDGLDLPAQEQNMDCQTCGNNSQMSVTIKGEESRVLIDDALREPLTRSLKSGRENRHYSVDELRSFQKSEREADEEGQCPKRGVRSTSENTKFRSSGIQETCPELAEPKKLIELEMENSQESLKEDKSERMLDNVRDERMDIQNELWWMNLPYALVILFRKGSDSEASRGLYSLKMHGVSSSYTVAFEDWRDATNFCYILETFFEDLGDFRADVVPLSISELKDAIKSSAMKVIVVRKGRLKLYAGQPLADVEATLRSFIT